MFATDNTVNRVQNASCCKHNKTYKGNVHTTIVLSTSNTTTPTGRNQRRPLDEIIAKVQLGTKIAQIALACPTCEGPVKKEIREFKNCHQEGSVYPNDIIAEKGTKPGKWKCGNCQEKELQDRIIRVTPNSQRAKEIIAERKSNEQKDRAFKQRDAEIRKFVRR
jgi:hypothetical protein